MYDHQKNLIQSNPNKTALIWDCGTGKTRTALEWSKSGGLTLCIVPKALVLNWQREIKKWGAKAQVLSKEMFKKLHKELPVFDQIIVDEVHNGFLTPHLKSAMSKALNWYLVRHNVPRVLLLTATPYTSSPWQIYTMAKHLGYTWNFIKFKITFFNEVRMGARIVPIPKKDAAVRCAELVKKIASVVALDECIDVPEQTFETEYFERTKEQNEWIEKIYDPIPIVRFTKQNEIENGVLKGNEFEKDVMGIPTLKHERLQSLVDENDKIIIVCRYNLQIDLLQQTLVTDKPILIIRGDVKDRDAVVQNAEKLQKAVVLIQSACSLGYELPSFRVMVFASLDWSFANFKQMCGRILRINNPQKNYYLSLITGGVDEAVQDALNNKKDFDIRAYERE